MFEKEERNPPGLSRDLCRAVSLIRSRSAAEVRVAIILGSGLGDIAETVVREAVFESASIPGFPRISAPGHVGKLVLGRIAGTRVAVMSGRPHLYEGLDRAAVAFPVRVFRQLGATTLIVTNAAGGVNRSFRAADLMVITDHIDLTFTRLPDAGNRQGLFFRRGFHYDCDLKARFAEEASRLGVELRTGTYAGLTGPNYETDAEMRMLERIGADAVGMSTVTEAVQAYRLDIKVLGISCIANARDRKTGLSHCEVETIVRKNAPVLGKLIGALIRNAAQ